MHALLTTNGGLRTGALIAAFHRAARPRVAARSPMGGASWPAMKAKGNLSVGQAPPNNQCLRRASAPAVPRRAVSHRRACASLVACCSARIQVWDVGWVSAAGLCVYWRTGFRPLGSRERLNVPAVRSGSRAVRRSKVS
jgi:hypothetical protein